MVALTPLFVVTLGADIRSTPFFWFRARMTIWKSGFVKIPAKPKIPGEATLAPWGSPAKRALRLLAVIAELTLVPMPERFPAVTGLSPTSANGKLL